MNKSLVVITVLSMIITVSAYADIQCNFVNGPCGADQTRIMGLSSGVSAHGELPSSALFPWSLCCGPNANFSLGTGAASDPVDAQFWTPFANLSGVTNAHGAVIQTPGYLQRLVINSSRYPLNCTYIFEPTCANVAREHITHGFQRIAGLSDLTNAHFGPHTDASFPVSICCSACQRMDEFNESCVGCGGHIFNASLSFQDDGRTTNSSCCGDDVNALGESLEHYFEDFDSQCAACCNQSDSGCYLNASGDSLCANDYITINGSVFEEKPNPVNTFGISVGARVEVKWKSSLLTMKANYTDMYGNYSLRVPNVTNPRHIVFSKSGYEPVTLDVVNGNHYTQNATLYLSSACRSDCSRFYEDFGTRELRCDATCDGLNGCAFPQNYSLERGMWVKELCDQKILGWETHFNFTPGGEMIVSCCNEEPRLVSTTSLELEADARKNIFTMSSSGYIYKGKPVVIYVTTWD